MGFFHSCGYIISGDKICFINSKPALKTFIKQLQQYYGFIDEKYFVLSHMIKQIKDTPIYELILTKEGSDKFFSILPNDYKEYFKLKTTYFININE